MKPNVLVLMCDQMNPMLLSCNGGPVPTPNIDKLAAEGAHLSQAICPAPVCSPSRASFLLGQYVHAHGIAHNCNLRETDTVDAPETEEGISNRDMTIDKIWAEAGYQTHHYGKWHLYEEDLDYWPDMYREHDRYLEDVGADFRKADELPADDKMVWYSWTLPVTRDPRLKARMAPFVNTWPDKPYADFVLKMGRLDLPGDKTFDGCVTAQTVNRLQKLDADKPFAVTCSWMWPHDPNVIPDPWYSMFDPDEIDLPANYEQIDKRQLGQWSQTAGEALGEAGMKEFLRIYYASCAFLDDQVGKVMDALEASGRADDTIVVFVADHGDMTGGHGMIWKSTDSFYDEIVRVPLMIRYPQGIQPGDYPLAANITDIAPTLLSLTGCSGLVNAEGVDLAPILRGERAVSCGPEFSYCERLALHPGHQREVEAERQGQFMIRSPKWKYIMYQDGDEKLYDLVNDPGEISDLSADHGYAETKDELKKNLLAFKQKAGLKSCTTT